MAPGITTDIIIPTGRTFYPVLNTPNGFCRSLTIQSGAGNPSLTIPATRTLTVNANSGPAITNAGLLKVEGTLTVARGNVVNNGTLTSVAGTVRFTNTATVDISGAGLASFYDITFAGAGLTRFGPASAPLTNADPTPIRIARRALLSATTGGNVEANGKVRFVSTTMAGTTPATPCGYIFQGGSGFFAGTITMERAISSLYNRGEGYRHYSTPVSAPAFTSLAVAATQTTAAFTPTLNTNYS